MQINNNYQSPNFGMALRVSKEGLSKYVAGSSERAKLLLELGERAAKADKEHEAKIIALLKEHNVSPSEHQYTDLVREYTPNIHLTKDGSLLTDSFRMNDRSFATIENDGQNTVIGEFGNDIDYLNTPEALDNALYGLKCCQKNALRLLSKKIEEISKPANLNKLMNDIIDKFGN